MDRHAHPGHSRGVRHRKILARGQRHLALDPDLSSLMHQEGAVRNAHHLAYPEIAQGFHDLLSVLLIPRVQRNVAQLVVLGDSFNINGADVGAHLADRRSHLPQVPGIAFHFQTESQTVAGTWFRKFTQHNSCIPR